MRTCDVLVVGGGPAGSSCAKRLGEAGLQVLILDRAVFPRDKPCAGWITPGVLETLGLPAGEYGDGRTLQPFTGFRTGQIGGPDVETRYARPMSFGIRRRELDAYLLERSGARVRTGVTVTGIRREGDGWIVNDEVRAPLLVGAGGHFCPVRRLLNGPRAPKGRCWPRRWSSVSTRPSGRLRSASRGPRVVLLPRSARLRLVRQERGLPEPKPGRRGHPLAGTPAEFVAFLVGRRRIPADLPSRWQGHAYRLYEPTPSRLADHGVLLVGDAAALADRASGEGSARPWNRACSPLMRSWRRGALPSRGPRTLRSRSGGPPGAAPAGVSWPPASPSCWAGGSGIPWFARELVLERWFLKPGRGPAQFFMIRLTRRLSIRRSLEPSGTEAPSSPVGSSERFH